jgi:hypothetical protein
VYANLINNLAGKYGSGFGTPFDLQELSGFTGLDVNHVTHVRLIDVIGSITNHACTDSSAFVINDPYPTNYPTGGFDLDAVGAIHFASTTQIADVNTRLFTISPVPCYNVLQIASQLRLEGSLIDAVGRPLLPVTLEKECSLDMCGIPAGHYYLRLTDSNGNTWNERIVKY